MWVYYKLNQSMVLLFKMFEPLIFVFLVSSTNFATIGAENFTNSPRDQDDNYCFLPSYPEHGKYTIKNYPSATPGESYPSVKLDVSCNTGYQTENNVTSIFCVNGDWSATMPICAPSCTLIDDLSVQYLCELSGPGSLKYSRECESMVPSGTVVTPICRSPSYFSLKAFPRMHCRDGIWDYRPICKPACGTITQHRQLEGTSSYHVELPWHALIYEKLTSSYNQICDGSLISSNIIISAAHCFWTDDTMKLLPASNFMVAVGKLYRLHYDLRDRNSQQSNVVDIKIPSSFRVGSRFFEYNIALVVVETPFIFHLSVRPVCLDFDYDLDGTQLKEGNSGITVSWSTTDNNDQDSEVLKIVYLSYLKNEYCIHNSPIYFGDYMTSDKFCAGSNNGTSLCEGGRDGGGLAFLESTTQRYYLRGVLSVNPEGRGPCNIMNPYTSILKHEDFIKQHL